MDGRLRALERTAQDDPIARQRLAAELERAGALEALDRRVEGLLAAVQAGGDDWPWTSKLQGEALAGAVGELLADPGPGWRLLIADHHFRSPTASPQGTYAALALDDDRLTLGVDRGDTPAADLLRAKLTREQAAPRDVLAVLREPARAAAVHAGQLLAAEWSRWRLRRTRLQFVENARRRPAMYVGDVHQRGAQQLAEEVLGRAVGWFAAGRCRSVHVRRHPDGACSIEDDGPGVSTAYDPRTGLSRLEALLTTHGPEEHEGAYVGRPGLHGVGVETTNALSAWLEAESHTAGHLVRQRFERGQAVGPPVIVGPTDRTGLTLTFLPDPTIFRPPVAIGAEWLGRRLRELCLAYAGLRATLEIVGAAGGPTSYESERGALDGLLSLLGDAPALLSAPIVLRGAAATQHGASIEVDAALTWSRAESTCLVEFVNGVQLVDGGPHHAALRAAATRALSPLAGGARLDSLRGLVAFVSLNVPEPTFEGCTKSRLASPEVAPVMRRLMNRAMRVLVAERPAEAGAVARHVAGRRRRLPCFGGRSRGS